MVAELARVGNPSSVHAPGRAARRAVEESRERLAATLGARPSDVIWTSGGTEADNLAVKGLWWARHGADPPAPGCWSAPWSTTPCSTRRAGWRPRARTWSSCPCTPTARSTSARSPPSWRRTATGSRSSAVMWANNEIGTVQPVAEVVGARARRTASRCTPTRSRPSATCRWTCGRVAVDAVTVTAHKLGGPVGVGALVARRGLDLVPVQHGGGQERSVRSGTLDAAGVGGLRARRGARDRRPAGRGRPGRRAAGRAGRRRAAPGAGRRAARARARVPGAGCRTTRI